MRVWNPFGLRSTGEWAAFETSDQMPSLSCATSLTRSLEMSLAISVMQAKTAWNDFTVSGLTGTAFCCHAPGNQSLTSGYHPPRFSTTGCGCALVIVAVQLA